MMFMITMPPTTMPIATTAGMTVNSTLVSCFQNVDERVGRLDGEVVLLAGVQTVRDAHRLLARAHRRRDLIRVGRIFTEIVVVCRRP